ncbi:MAG: AmmeMemoRadiSam system protein A [Candidatus Polarisedimenticolaceae bacterium]|nr:AmmeMemoRadiSam system protein A [Candidatus Polarisedimenticolaceae bacterium]
MQPEIDQKQQQLLLDLAHDAIEHGLAYGAVKQINLADYPTELQPFKATFVTLTINGQLRGCIGMLQACRPLLEDIVHNAFAAAFSDPRFPPLTADELPQLEIHISILNPAEPMQFTSEADLISQLRPGIDGLILDEGDYRGTFLPSVWQSLAKPEDFLRQLKLKAGLSADHWSSNLQVQRYTTTCFPTDL